MYKLPPRRQAPGMPLADRRAVVFGMARSGLAAADFLRSRGALPLLADEAPADQLTEALARVAALDLNARPGLASYEELGSFDLLVTSPGIPANHPVVVRARRQGVEVIGELELAYRFSAAPLVAVTGTNGKGSTTTLLGGMLSAAGLRCVVAGNIGLPLISVVDRELDVLVAEVSSFQLETTIDFHPWAAVLLNVTPDHLSRHRSFQEYVAAKRRLFMNQGSDDVAVLNLDDPAAAALAPGMPGALIVSVHDQTANGYVAGGRLMVHLPPQPPMPVGRVEDLALPGDHYLVDALCAGLVAVAAGCSGEQVRRAVRAWRPAAHQLSTVGTVAGVTYIDDSKATNPAAAMADLNSLSGPLLVVAGGRNKGLDLSDFADLLARRAKAVFLIGEAAEEIAAAIGQRVPVASLASLEQAVGAAAGQAEAGDSVVLAPACASFDQFRGQAERGEHFAAAVQALYQERPQTT